MARESTGCGGCQAGAGLPSSGLLAGDGVGPSGAQVSLPGWFADFHVTRIGPAPDNPTTRPQHDWMGCWGSGSGWMLTFIYANCLLQSRHSRERVDGQQSGSNASRESTHQGPRPAGLECIGAPSPAIEHPLTFPLFPCRTDDLGPRRPHKTYSRQTEALYPDALYHQPTSALQIHTIVPPNPNETYPIELGMGHA